MKKKEDPKPYKADYQGATAKEVAQAVSFQLLCQTAFNCFVKDFGRGGRSSRGVQRSFEGRLKAV